MADTLPPSLPCFLVNNLSTNSVEQCKFILDNECLEEDSLIDYVYLVYCDIGSLSAVADEFLCPSLLAVAKNLRMSDSLAGVTLLAFGNGCPDIFSSLAAASGDRSELIVGELLGAGIFCTSIVAGLIFIHSDFKLACRPILRDTTFYLLAVYLIWSYCWAEEITFYGSLAFIIIYVIYLIVALGGQAIHSRLQGDYSPQASSRDETKEDSIMGNWFKWREESLRRRQQVFNQNKLENMPIKANVQVGCNEGVTSIHLGPTESSKQQNYVETECCTYFTKIKTSNSAMSDSNTKSVGANGCPNRSNLFAVCPPSSPNSSQQNQQVANKTETAFKQQNEEASFNEWDEFLAHINPIDMDDWSEIRFFVKLMRILRAPFLLAAILTVPVVDMDKRINNWCKPLNAIHCITVPLTITVATKFGCSEHISLFGTPLPVLILIPSSLLAIFILKTTSFHKAPKIHPLFAYFGFIMSILWIYLLATEIIGLLKTVGIMFSMTDTAIGLGILAWGNSLGDIVANTTLAEAGYPRMALGAACGAPLLNLLLGFGLSYTINLKPGEFAAVKYSSTIGLLCFTLAAILILIMLSTLVPPEKSKKPFGYLLICCYGVYFSTACCLEYGLINF